jgi:tRNA A-37 threonylcarbamoyl transferase component Bud32/Tol biopolymer transport system component
MTLAAGTQLGNYEIVALLGQGGMGEVYKARDPKLGRLVAIKVLPASLAQDRDLLARFEREARAVATLSHPNVLGIFDFARDRGITYAVMELLEGENLRDRLRTGALPARRAVEIAIELAHGLGAAHAQGIVHRDVKPENIFLTADGRVKVLDFGLAKQLASAGARPGTAPNALGISVLATEMGIVLGTVGYMSPEQVRGEAADHRSDIFSFGVVLHEMLSGQRPFRGDSPVQTMAAILDQEPPELLLNPVPQPALARLLAHCLEKRAEARFQSMKDVAFALENLATASSAPPGRNRALRPRGPALLAAAGAVAATLLGLTLSAFLGWPPFTAKEPPAFTRLTFTPGTVESAFFGPDGRTVYFSERILGGPPELFVLHADSAEPRSLGVANALLLGVSRDSELAVLRTPVAYFQAEYRGTLAQVGGEGGAVREVREKVLNAAWDGQGLITLSCDDHDQLHLEFPVGRTILSADASARMLRFLRLSRSGERLALVDSDSVSRTELVVYDRAGRRSVLFTKTGDATGDTLTGLAWGPGGELWFSELVGDQTAVWAQPAGGRRRLLWRGEGTKALMDVSVQGRMLLANHQVRRGVLVRRAGEERVREVSVAGSSQACGLSGDGRTLLMMESPILDGGTPRDRAYLSRLDGSPALRVARGTPWSLSPDGRWIQLQFSGFSAEDLDPTYAAALRQAGLEPKAALDANAPQPYLLFAPTGAGSPFAVALPKHLEPPGYAFLHPDGKRILFNSGENGKAAWYLIDRAGGPVRAVSPPGFGKQFVGLLPLSPDGSRMLVIRNSSFFIQPLAGGEPQPIRGIRADERPLGWSQDQRAIYTRSEQWLLPVTVNRVDLATGGHRQLFQYMPGDPAGILMIRSVLLPPDGSVCALDYVRQLSELYLVDGIR